MLSNCLFKLSGYLIDSTTSKNEIKSWNEVERVLDTISSADLTIRLFFTLLVATTCIMMRH